MAEWSIAQPWKGCERLRVPRVRIPVCPPIYNLIISINIHFGALFYKYFVLLILYYLTKYNQIQA